MLGIDWPVWAGIGLVLAWKALRVVKPSWAKQVRKVKGVARNVLDTTLIVARLGGWTGVFAKVMYIARVEGELKARGLPTSTKAMRAVEGVWLDHLRDLTADEAIKGLTDEGLKVLVPPSMRKRPL